MAKKLSTLCIMMVRKSTTMVAAQMVRAVTSTWSCSPMTTATMNVMSLRKKIGATLNRALVQVPGKNHLSLNLKKLNPCIQDITTLYGPAGAQHTDHYIGMATSSVNGNTANLNHRPELNHGQATTGILAIGPNDCQSHRISHAITNHAGG